MFTCPRVHMHEEVIFDVGRLPQLLSTLSRRAHLLTPELALVTSLTTSLVTLGIPDLCLLKSGITDGQQCPLSNHMGSGDLNFSPHMSMASTVPTEHIFLAP